MAKGDILSDGSVEGQTFSGDKYTGPYPSPKYGKETYSDYYNRINQLKEQGFHLGDLSWSDWGTYCAGSPYHDSYLQNNIIR